MAKIYFMKKISLFIIVDNMFKLLLLFLLNLIWCTYFIKSAPISICVSLALAIAIILISNKISDKKMGKKIKSLKLEQRMLDICNTFIYMQNTDILDFFRRLVLSKHSCEIVDNYIIIQTSSKPICLYPMFRCVSLSADDVLDIYKKIKKLNLKRLVILTNSVSNEANIQISNFNFETLILDYKQTYYELLNKYEFYPEITIKSKTKAKSTFKQLLAISLNKKKTKGYLLSAIFIFFASFFVKFRIYYLIVSSMLIILAILSFSNHNFNKVEQKQLLE